MQVNRNRQQSMSLRWIIGASRSKAGKPMYLRLADELMAAYRREGLALRALAPLWQITLNEGDACTQALQQQLACINGD